MLIHVKKRGKKAEEDKRVFFGGDTSCVLLELRWRQRDANAEHEALHVALGSGCEIKKEGIRWRGHYYYSHDQVLILTQF